MRHGSTPYVFPLLGQFKPPDRTYICTKASSQSPPQRIADAIDVDAEETQITLEEQERHYREQQRLRFLQEATSQVQPTVGNFSQPVHSAVQPQVPLLRLRLPVKQPSLAWPHVARSCPPVPSIPPAQFTVVQPQTPTVLPRTPVAPKLDPLQSKPQRHVVSIAQRRAQLEHMPLYELRRIIRDAPQRMQHGAVRKSHYIDRILAWEYSRAPGTPLPQCADPPALAQPTTPYVPIGSHAGLTPPSALTPLPRAQPSIKEQLEQLRQRLQSEETALVASLRTNETVRRHMPAQYRIVDVLAAAVTRQGQHRDCTFDLSEEQRRYQVHVAPMTLQFQPDMWMESVMDVYMVLGMNDVFVDSFPPGWRRKNPSFSVFRTYLLLDLTFALNTDQNQQRFSVQFSKNDVQTWEGVVAVFLLEPIPVVELIERVRERSTISCDAEEDDDAVCCTESVSLRCPLTLQPLSTPAKGKTCRHASCFELQTFIEYCEKQNTWNCPLCNFPCPYADLFVDQKLLAILESSEITARPNVTEVMLNSDGSFVCKEPALADFSDDD
eukprot:TRINITY_DN9512_c0_g1_i1.p1 TRINITY_DN9512_c0_g1~~TRINITY_DN9512_c0_g1_i1.p1  ORF type:complete len:552 (-),score=65.95 TRINITY_DN9512_c0_g1_i1:5-1660(-)